MTYQLPMMECSACGNHVGHMYDDYYELSKRLYDDIASSDDGFPKLEGIYLTKRNRDLKPFLQTYYNWLKKQDGLEYYEPANVIARALLSVIPLTETALPYSKEPDNQLGVFEARMCCMRMFQADPSYE